MIVEMERADWVNECGYEEGYVWKNITMRKSGHLWSGSAMETDDSCGNCDGANCDSCQDVYEVFKWSEPKPHIDPTFGWHDYNYQEKLDHYYTTSKQDAVDYYDKLTL